MTFLEGKGSRVIDKINGENFNLWKFRLEMGLAVMDLWGIVDESKEDPPSNVEPKVKKKKNTKNVSKRQCLSLRSS